ncbi:MAG TPA: thiol reductase thioredoxin [Bacteroidetes bacterium]|jgi:thiol-disulfide isomerase/thioredoxin|nr:thiol reductase thioredoxin [Bacteroidota bacterium]
MMQRLLLFLLIVCFLSGCGGTVGTKSEVIEIGWLERSVFDKPELHQFKARYDTVVLDRDLVGLIGNVNEGVDFLVFLGTWCGDSRREVPHFLKIADQCGIAPSRVRLHGLDRAKKSEEGLAEQYNIKLVPTFIFLKNGTEVGRITEKPNATLEADMLSILSTAQQK